MVLKFMIIDFACYCMCLLLHVYTIRHDYYSINDNCNSNQLCASLLTRAKGEVVTQV